MNFRLSETKAIGSLILGLILSYLANTAGYCKEDYCTTYLFDLTGLSHWFNTGWLFLSSGIIIVMIYLVWSLFERK